MQSESIKVVHYVSGFAETSGGIESILLAIFSQFEEETRYEQILLTRYAYTSSVFYSKFSSRGFRVISLDLMHLKPTNYLTFKKRLKSFFRENKVDVLHIHGTDEPLILSVSKKAGVKKIIIHAHTPDMELNGRPKIYKVTHSWFGRKNILKADIRLACSKETGEKVFGKAKFEVVNNGIDVDAYRFDNRIREEYRKKLGCDGVLLGHVGRFVDVKNHKFILEVFKSFKTMKQSTKLMLVGDGPLLENIKQYARELDMFDDVYFLGERTDIPSLLKATDAFIMPSKFEGLGISFIEAQASGLPCVASDRVSIETKVTDLVRYKSLDAPISEWVEALNYAVSRVLVREDYAGVVEEQGYGTKRLYQKIERIYSM